MSHDKDDVRTVLKKWHDTKEKMDILEEKLKKYKTKVGKIMNEKKVDKIEAGGFIVKRRHNTRTSLSRESVPADIWKEYATKSHFDVYTLTKGQ